MYIISTSNRTNFCIKPVIVSYYSNLPYVQHHDSKSDRHTIACSGFLFTTYYVCKSNEQWPNWRGVYSWLTRTNNVHNVKRFIVGKWSKCCHESGLTSVNCEFLTTVFMKAACYMRQRLHCSITVKTNQLISHLRCISICNFFCRQSKGFQSGLKKNVSISFFPKLLFWIYASQQ